MRYDDNTFIGVINYKTGKLAGNARCQKKKVGTEVLV